MRCNARQVCARPLSLRMPLMLQTLQATSLASSAQDSRSRPASNHASNHACAPAPILHVCGAVPAYCFNHMLCCRPRPPCQPRDVTTEACSAAKAHDPFRLTIHPA